MFFSKFKKIKYKKTRNLITSFFIFWVLFILTLNICNYLFPLNLYRYQNLSTQNLSNEGKVLRSFLSADDKNRLKSSYDNIPQIYWDMLIRI